MDKWITISYNFDVLMFISFYYIVFYYIVFYFIIIL